jgi:hypothetical protein
LDVCEGDGGDNGEVIGMQIVPVVHQELCISWWWSVVQNARHCMRGKHGGDAGDDEDSGVPWGHP